LAKIVELINDPRKALELPLDLQGSSDRIGSLGVAANYPCIPCRRVIKADGSIAPLRQGSSASRHARLQILPAIMKKLDGNPAQRFHIKGCLGC
jgi:hypothetical protein